jgi:hypothetical protein
MNGFTKYKACPSIWHIVDPIEQYSAVQLFIYNAQRMLAGFNPNSEDLAAIARICQIVDGIPLAIELATAWIRTLSCKEIAIEIELNLDFLSTTSAIYSRHRSRALYSNILELAFRRSTHLSQAGRIPGDLHRSSFTLPKLTHCTCWLADRSFDAQSIGRFEIIGVLRHFAEYKLRESRRLQQYTYCAAPITLSCI